jgi:hypothetical protein
MLNGNTWGSDRSMKPAAVGILDNKIVTAAITGPITLTMKISGRNSNILHGEVLSLIMGHILSPAKNDNHLLYTDHLNSVRFLQDIHTRIDQISKQQIISQVVESAVKRNRVMGGIHKRTLRS